MARSFTSIHEEGDWISQRAGEEQSAWFARASAEAEARFSRSLSGVVKPWWFEFDQDWDTGVFCLRRAEPKAKILLSALGANIFLRHIGIDWTGLKTSLKLGDAGQRYIVDMANDALGRAKALYPGEDGGEIAFLLLQLDDERYVLRTAGPPQFRFHEARQAWEILGTSFQTKDSRFKLLEARFADNPTVFRYGVEGSVEINTYAVDVQAHLSKNLFTIEPLLIRDGIYLRISKDEAVHYRSVVREVDQLISGMERVIRLARVPWEGQFKEHELFDWITKIHARDIKPWLRDLICKEMAQAHNYISTAIVPVRVVQTEIAKAALHPGAGPHRHQLERLAFELEYRPIETLAKDVDWAKKFLKMPFEESIRRANFLLSCPRFGRAERLKADAESSRSQSPSVEAAECALGPTEEGNGTSPRQAPLPEPLPSEESEPCP